MSSLITAGELALDRADQALLFPDSAAVYRRVQTPDTSGGNSYTWPTLTHTYACRVAPQSPSRYLLNERVSDRQQWVVTFAYGADVLSTDKIVAGGHTLYVVGFQSGGAWATALRVVCEENS